MYHQLTVNLWNHFIKRNMIYNNKSIIINHINNTHHRIQKHLIVGIKKVEMKKKISNHYHLNIRIKNQMFQNNQH